MTSDASRRLAWGLGAALVLGAALRLHTLGAESLWLDEACSIEAAQKSLAGIVEYTADDVHPPLYYWVLHYWIQVAGRSEFALRLLSVVFSLLTIGLVCRLANRLFGPGTALVAAFLLALSPFHLASAQEARMYAMLACLGAWSLSALVRLLDDPAAPSRTVIASALATAMMLYTHAYGLFTFGAQVLVVGAAAILQRRGSSGRWKRAALAQALAFVLFLPWLPLFFVQLFHVQDSFWIPPMPAAELGRTLIAFAGGPMAVVLLPLALFAVVKDRRARWTWFLLIWAAAPVLVPFALSVVSSPIFLTKYSIAGSLALLLLAAHGAALLPSWRWSAVVLVAAAGLAVPAIRDDYRTVSKDDWRRAVPRLEALAQPGDLVLFDQSFGRVVYDYYSRRGDLIEEPFAPLRRGLTPRTLVDALEVSARPFDRVWLVVSSWDPAVPQMLERVQTTFDLSTHLSDRGVNSYLFVRKPK